MYLYRYDIMMSSSPYGAKMPQSSSKPTPAADAVTGLILDLFRLNNLLLTVGDRLVEGLGLTSARWQVLGAIAYADRPQPVSWLARDMEANRQNVQRIINDLNAAGLVTFETNPHHRRAQLVVLTEKGKRIFEAAMRLQGPWVNDLAQDLAVRDIEAAQRVLSKLRQRLDGKDKA
jgi:DNA-binding MarR family transcriptional regulator